jgi:predicted ArsR family transcriptional regulator
MGTGEHAVTVRDFARHVTSIAALAEPVRRALYFYVIAQQGPVSRDQAAAALGVPRHVAKFNLDKLEEEELLDVEFARPPGRSGPGAGRPAKLYKRSAREVEVSLPERHYDLAAQVMAQAIAQAVVHEASIGDALRETARQTGRALGEQARQAAGSRPSRASVLRAVQEVLVDRGYEPREDAGGLSMANCPFHALAEAHRDLVCGMNRDLIDGLLQTAGPHGARAELRPSQGMCCVQIVEA